MTYADVIRMAADTGADGVDLTSYWLPDTEDATLSIAIELEGLNYSRLRQSDDFHEGVEAFYDKRTPKFRGT